MPSITTSVYLAVALLVAVSSAQLSSRILGGDEAVSGSFPYAISLRVDGVHNCGGTIIGEKTIITAARCLFEQGAQLPLSRLSIRVGSINQFAGGQIVYAAAVKIHPDFKNFTNNLALIHLGAALQWTDRIQSIPYATEPSQQPPVDAVVTVAGWGEQSDDGSAYKLHYITFTVAKEEVCLDAYSEADDSLICLAHPLNKGNCYGDAGNAATYNGRLVGLANFVVGACGSRFPDVFTNVAHYATWIGQNLA